MGKGRNAINLASIGWDVTGYDNSQAALTVAARSASKAGVTITAVLAAHDEFDFGVEQWDLIVHSYNFCDVLDPKWPAVVWRALRPGGIVVWQTGGPPYRQRLVCCSGGGAVEAVSDLRLEHPEGKSDDWLPDMPFIRMC